MLIEEAIEKFNSELPEEIRYLCSGSEVMDPLRMLEKKYSVNFSVVFIFFAIGEIKVDDISTCLEEEYHFERRSSEQITKEFDDVVLKPLLDRINFINTHLEKTMTFEQEKTFAIKMFEESLIVKFKNHPLVIDAYNQRLLYILAKDLSFQKRLEQAFYQNNEKVSSKPIILNSQSVSSTVTNWIKDYISQYGGQTYDSMSQTNFLLNSENSRNLSIEERSVLAKVLKTYINIKFFPDSMDSDDSSDWEIIPLEKTVVESKTSQRGIGSVDSFSNKETGIPELISEKPIAKPSLQQSKPVSTIPKPSVAEKKSISPQSSIPVFTPKPTIKPNSQPVVATPKVLSKAPTPVEHSDEVMSLKNILLQYPADSLERKAIEEEIKKHS